MFYLQIAVSSYCPKLYATYMCTCNSQYQLVFDTLALARLLKFVSLSENCIVQVIELNPQYYTHSLAITHTPLQLSQNDWQRPVTSN